LTGRQHSLKPIIIASRQSRVYQSIFYPNADQLSEAAVILLHPGQNTHGIDLKVPLLDSVDVSGTIDSVKGRLANVVVRVVRPGNMGLETLDLAAASATTDETGHFVVLGVPPGQYTLIAEYRTVEIRGPTVTNGPNGPVVSGSISVKALSDETPLLHASSDLIVGSENITNCNLTLVQAPSLRGVIRFDGRNRLPDAKTLTSRAAILRAIVQGLPSVRAKIDSTGEFYFPSLMPGPYLLSTDNIPGWFVHSIESDGKPVGDGPIDLQNQWTHSVEVHMTDHTPSIDGVVVRKDGQGEPNAFVLLFPSPTLSRKANVAIEDTRLVNVSAAGQFTVQPLKPGDYFLIALSDAWFDLDWREQEVLQILAKTATRIRLEDRQVGAVTLTSQVVRPQRFD
jgi:hypothetical protein